MGRKKTAGGGATTDAKGLFSRKIAFSKKNKFLREKKPPEAAQPQTQRGYLQRKTRVGEMQNVVPHLPDPT